MTDCLMASAPHLPLLLHVFACFVWGAAGAPSSTVLTLCLIPVFVGAMHGTLLALALFFNVW